MLIFEKFLRKNLLKLYTRTHQIAPFKKNSQEKCPEITLQSAWLCSMSQSNMKFPNLKTKILNPPPAKSCLRS